MADTTTSDNQQTGGTDGQGQHTPAPAASTDSTPAADQTEVAGQQGGQDSGSKGGSEQSGQNESKGSDKGDGGKSFTQADLDRIINERLAKQEKSFTDRIAKAFGVEDGEETDPAKLLEQSQATTKAEQTRADTAEAKALALAAGIKPERVERFVKLVDVNGALKGADRSDASAVSEKLQAAVNATLEDVPEFKGSTVPASSGGDRSSGESGKPVYTREQIKKMSRDEYAEKQDDIEQAAAEGRIKG